MYCEIVAIPSGEAPEDVRAAWIGCVLPVLDSGLFDGVSVLSGRDQDVRGFVVNGKEAFAVLRQHNVDAFRWWQENASVWLDQRLIFDVAAIQMRPGVWIVRQVVAGVEYDHGPFENEKTANGVYDQLRRDGFRVMCPVEMPPDYCLLTNTDVGRYT
jgi:hypothetical protein